MDAEQTLLRSLAIETSIPEDGTTDLAELLEDAASPDDVSATRILNCAKRGLLFIDEKLRAVAALRIRPCDESVLRSLLSRTEFKVEVWQLDRNSSESNSAPHDILKELTYSTTVKEITDPIVVAQENEQDGDALILVWEIELVLSRPRVRMHDPSVFLRSVVVVSSSDADVKTEATFLAPFKAKEPNVLEPMRNMPGFEREAPYLAASRLERVQPATPQDHKQFKSEHMSSGYKIVPAVITRMRYSRMSTPTPMPTLIASLDIEIIPLIEVKGRINVAEVAMANGKVEDLMPQCLPMDCQSHDLISLLYRLHAGKMSTTMASPITPGAMPNLDILSVTLGVRIDISETTQATVNMTWTTNVDFFQALNPSFGAPTQPIQRVNRPMSLSLSKNNDHASQSISTSLQAVLEPSAASAVTVSFTAPTAPVEVGKAFSWNVLVVNGSSKPAKLAIIPLPRVPRVSHTTSHFARRHAPKLSSASFQAAERRHSRGPEADVDFAQAVMDENVVYAMQHANTASSGTDLIATTAEIRIGPLAPGQCHEGVIEMMALKAGTLLVDAVRVIDLVREGEEGATAAGVMLDIRDLPDVVAVESISAT
jgi:hypothetical protein